MILAQYTIRAKQEYIFKTNRVLEIVGASECIARIWDELFACARKAELKCQRVTEAFHFEHIQDAFHQGTLNIVELFQGGGNETLLFDSPDSYVRLNRAFSYQVLAEYPGMIPMAAYTKVTGDYSRDYAALMQNTERKKNVMVPEYNLFTVPFAMVDRTTYQPYSEVIFIHGTPVRMSDESRVKYQAGRKLRDKYQDIKLFDEMVTRKGTESLLAVVHADGNNMGAKIMEMLHDEKNYDTAVHVMRKFTQTTADCFEKEGRNALETCRDRLLEKNRKQLNKGKLKESSLSYRRIVGSGDDVTFICNARFVMEYTVAYLRAVQNYQKKHKESPWRYSSCAGICIFHSHYPFSRAYAIAEQACDDGAKQKVHMVDPAGRPIPVEQGWVDFHFIHSGISGDMEEIRISQGTKNCMARPWLAAYGEQDQTAAGEVFRYEKLLQLKSILDQKQVARTNIKEIGSAYERSRAAAEKELIHVYGHTEGLQRELQQLFPEEESLLKALYDFSEIYDIWYGEVK